MNMKFVFENYYLELSNLNNRLTYVMNGLTKVHLFKQLGYIDDIKSENDLYYFDIMSGRFYDIHKCDKLKSYDPEYVNKVMINLNYSILTWIGFIHYEVIRLSGDYNMILDTNKIMIETGINPLQYFMVQTYYNKLMSLFSDTIDNLERLAINYIRSGKKLNFN